MSKKLSVFWTVTLIHVSGSLYTAGTWNRRKGIPHQEKGDYTQCDANPIQFCYIKRPITIEKPFHMLWGVHVEGI